MAQARGRTIRSKRARTLDRLYRRRLTRFLLVAAVVHLLLILFAVAPTMDRGFEVEGDEIAVIDIPPETRIPPPPEELARPATPVMATEAVEEEVTIAVTDIVENAPVAPAPAPDGPSVVADDSSTFSFTPYTQKPRCVTGCSSDDVLKFYPPLARKSGVACDVRIGLKIDTSGHVVATDVLTGSGSTQCDEAVRRWAQSTAWTAAYNRDEPVVVWIAQPVQITAQ